MELLKIVPAPKGSGKKYEAFFKDKKTGKEKKTPFGARGFQDYTQHRSIERRTAYRKRHEKDLKTNDPTRAGYLSLAVLWNKPTLNGSIRDYKRRLNIYNKTGKFPTEGLLD